MIGGFGKKNKSFGNNYGKKNTSKFKKAVVAGGLLLAAGAGIYASAGDKETHTEVEYPLVAEQAGEGLGHNPALVEKLSVVGVDVGKVDAPPPAIDLAAAEKALEPPKAKKQKIAAGLKLAGEVVGGDVGKVGAVKKGIDIARGQGEAASTKSLQEQIQQAEKNAKKNKQKINREYVGVGVAPVIGPVAPPEHFAQFEDEETKKNKKQKVASFFAKPFKRG